MSDHEKTAPEVQVVDMKESDLDAKEPKLVGLRWLSDDEWALMCLAGIGFICFGIIIGAMIWR